MEIYIVPIFADEHHSDKLQRGVERILLGRLQGAREGVADEPHAAGARSDVQPHQPRVSARADARRRRFQDTHHSPGLNNNLPYYN